MAAADFKNPIHFAGKETVVSNSVSRASLSGLNRVFSSVAEPTYSIHAAAKADANGVGLVICPGGGYRDVWLDREGHDLALWLKTKGITSLVLKYRTDNGEGKLDRNYPWEVYLPAVFADARQAIRILRSQSAELNLDPNKIGICGFWPGVTWRITQSSCPSRVTSLIASAETPISPGCFIPG